MGIVFNNKGCWAPNILHRNNALARETSALFSFALKLCHKSLRHMLKLYKDKCLPGAYGTRIWGESNIKPLQLTENKALRRLLAVCQNTATAICHRELGLDLIENYLKWVPALLWHKVWTSDEALLKRLIIQGCLGLNQAVKIPWLQWVKNPFIKLNRVDLFEFPGLLESVSKCNLNPWCRSQPSLDRVLSMEKMPTVMSHL